MNAQRLRISITFTMACFFVVSLACSACGANPVRVASAPTPSLDETSVKEYVIKDFGAVHAQVNGNANQYLIFGNLPVSKQAADLSPELAVFLGRWEGYSYSPPIKKDRKLVLVVQEITAQGGTAFGWSGTNLQYPDLIGEIHFRVVTGTAPSIEWQIIWPDGTREIESFTYDHEKDSLQG